MTIVETKIRESAPEYFFLYDRDFWRASTLAFGSIVILIALLAILQVISSDIPAYLQVIISILVSIIPPLVFLADMQIRKRRVNKGYASILLVLFILGGLLAVAVTRPFLFQLIKLDDWLGIANSRNRLISNIFIAGAWHAFLLFSAIRFGIWNTHLFTRKTDGLAFTYAVAWGYSAAYGALMAIDYGSLSVLNGNLRILTFHCNVLTIATIIGYSLGKHKFERTPFYFLPLATLISYFLGGLLLYACVELNATSLAIDSSGYSPWPGIIVALLATLGLFYAAAGLLNREATVIENRIGGPSV